MDCRQFLSMLVLHTHWIFWIALLDTLHTAHAQCGGSALTLTAGMTVQKFTSPNYPTSYSNNLNCQWLLDSQVAGQKIVLYSDNYDMDCTYGDNINIYDGSTTGASTLASNLCGNSQVSNEYVSSGQYVLVTFTSDAATAGQGFEMTYFSAPDTSSTGCSAEVSLTASSTPQYLSSNSFPNSYSSDSACRWLISAPGSLSTISLEIVWSDIEADASCSYDKLEVYTDRYVCENAVLFTDCTIRTSADATPTVYTSPGNTVLVTFTSDDSYQKHGFVLKYSATIAYSTTTVSTSTTSSTASVSTNTITDTVTEINIPLMAVSALAGAGLVLAIMAAIWFIKRLHAIKTAKKGITMVQTIAPLPARPTAVAPTPTTALSFV